MFLFGYNGTPSGWDNTCEADNKTLPYVLHAEMNCILKCAEEGVSTKVYNLYLRTLLAGTVQLVCLSAGEGQSGTNKNMGMR